MSDFFTSDTHFGHANIIAYCGRPFRDVEEMNRTMIERWNARVRPGDTVYHLGDFAMGPVAGYREYGRALNGHKVLILGNHDRGREAMRQAGFHKIHKMLVYRGVLLRHHPQTDLAKMGFKIQLCGHVHEEWAFMDSGDGGLIFNVGVDRNDFRPVTFREVLGERFSGEDSGA